MHHLSSVGMFVQCQNSWWHVSTSSKSSQHTLASSKYWRHFSPHLQGFVGISLHLQSLDRDFLQLQRLVGISEISMSGYSAMHPWCLSYVASEDWCCCSFIIKIHISATSMQVQVLMWSIDMASWQRWLLAWLLCKWSFDVALGMLARLRCDWSVDVASWQRWVLTWLRCEWSVTWLLRCDWSVEVVSWQRWVLTRLWCEWSVDMVASMQMKCWCGFMTKMSVDMALVWMKCRCGLSANKMSRQIYGKRRVLVQLHYKGKWWCDFIADASANIASWQRQMLAQLQCEDKCWHGFMVKTFHVAILQRLLRWLCWKDKCWCSLMKENLVLYPIQNSQWKRHSWIYFIHDW